MPGTVPCRTSPLAARMSATWWLLLLVPFGWRADGSLSSEFRDWKLIRAWARMLPTNRPQSNAEESAMTDRMDDDEVPATFNGISPTRCVELLQTQTVGRVAWEATAGQRSCR